jgi:hypothetical protein
VEALYFLASSPLLALGHFTFTIAPSMNPNLLQTLAILYAVIHTLIAGCKAQPYGQCGMMQKCIMMPDFSAVRLRILNSRG